MTNRLRSWFRWQLGAIECSFRWRGNKTKRGSMLWILSMYFNYLGNTSDRYSRKNKTFKSTKSMLKNKPLWKSLNHNQTNCKLTVRNPKRALSTSTCLILTVMSSLNCNISTLKNNICKNKWKNCLLKGNWEQKRWKPRLRKWRKQKSKIFQSRKQEKYNKKWLKLQK